MLRWISERFVAHRYGLSVIACALVTSFVAAMPFVVDVPSHSYHQDEDCWIYGTCYYRLFFKNHDFTCPDWGRRDTKFNGPMAKYVLGYGIELAGVDFKPTASDMEMWWPSNDTLPEKTPRVSPQLLHAGRMTCAVMGAAAAMLLFFIGFAVSGRLAGICTSLLFASNQLVLSICRHAMADATLLFFIVASVLCMTLLVMALRDPRKHWFGIILLTVAEIFSIGSAVGTKFNGALVSFAFVLAMVIAALAFAIHPRPGSEGQPRRWWTRPLGMIGILLLTGVIGAGSFGVFVYFNPYLHTAPIEHTRELYEVTSNDLQMTLNQFPQDQLKTWGQKIDYVWGEVALGRDMFLPKEPSQWLGGTLTVVGLLYLVIKLLVNLWKRRPGGELAIFAWVLLATAGVIYWIPMHWDRYLTPLLPCGSVVSGLALAEILKFGCAAIVKISSSKLLSPAQTWQVPAAPLLATVGFIVVTAAIFDPGLPNVLSSKSELPRKEVQSVAAVAPATQSSKKSPAETTASGSSSKFALPSAPPPAPKDPAKH
jgi:hypothetical protein